MAIPDDVRGKRKSDRRVVRTRKAIREAFEKLIQTENISEISVSELAREADIDRKTFYLHYNSVSEVASQVLESYLDEALSTVMRKTKGMSVSERANISLSVVDELIMNNLTLFQNIARKFSPHQLMQFYMDHIESALEANGYTIAESERNHFQLRMGFYFAGSLALYLAWLQDDKSMPIEMVSDAIKEALRSDAVPNYYLGKAFNCVDGDD